MLRALTRIVGCLGLVGVASCAAIVGFDDDVLGPSGGGGGGGMAKEDCTNGKDDDGDGRVDCADPDCADYRCTPGVPAGWEGPAAFHIGGAETPPPCGPDWSERIAGGQEPTGKPAACSACTCGAPEGVTCSATTVSIYVNQGCDETAGATTFNVPGPEECLGFGDVETQGSMLGNVMSAIGGTCKPGGGAADKKPGTFEKSAALCVAPSSGGGCGSGSCVAPPPTGYGGAVCIFARKDTSCPQGPYSVRTLIQTDFDDTRGCTPCTCGDPVGDNCDAVTQLFNDQSCTMPSNSYPDNATCVSFGGALPTGSILIHVPNGPGGGTCTPSGSSAPTGTLVGKSPVTVCCTK